MRKRLRHLLNPMRVNSGKHGGSNPVADANPPEDQEHPVERVEVA
jgi:hypothetical protein